MSLMAIESHYLWKISLKVKMKSKSCFKQSIKKMDLEFIISKMRQTMKNIFTLNLKLFMHIKHSRFLTSLISEQSLNLLLLPLRSGLQLEMELLEKNQSEEKLTLILQFLESLMEKILLIVSQKRTVVNSIILMLPQLLLHTCLHLLLDLSKDSQSTMRFQEDLKS